MPNAENTGNNPFENLNIKDFPKSIKKNSSPAFKKGRKANIPEDEDERLFLDAIGELDRTPQKKEGNIKKDVNMQQNKLETDKEENFAAAFADLEKSLSAEKAKSKTPRPLETSSLQKNLSVNIPSQENASLIKDTFTPVEFKEKSFENDEDMFMSAIEGTSPLGGHGRIIAPPAIVANKEENRNPLQDLLDGKVEFAIESTGEYAEGHIVGLDLNVVSQLQNGHFSPEAHIDLHGLNSDQACHNLIAFIRSSYLKGLRMVIVVTGRGNNSFNGIPVLKGRVQEWFTQHPLKRVILAYCTARQEDGGIGAFYVLLRKRKKTIGKIQWDLIPTDLESL